MCRNDLRVDLLTCATRTLPFKLRSHLHCPLLLTVVCGTHGGTPCLFAIVWFDGGLWHSFALTVVCGTHDLADAVFLLRAALSRYMLAGRQLKIELSRPGGIRRARNNPLGSRSADSLQGMDGPLGPAGIPASAFLTSASTWSMHDPFYPGLHSGHAPMPLAPGMQAPENTLKSLYKVASCL